MLKPDNPFVPEYPAGKFFAGRERQLKLLGELLDGLSRGTSSNLCVVGRGGEGKTSYLEKVIEEARKRGLVATKCVLDISKPAETDIDTIVQSLLRDLEAATGQKHIASDWASGDKSSFRAPRYKEIRSDQLQIDFQHILDLLPSDGPKGCVICIDEGQRINPIALTALKNSLQPLGRGYLIALSLLNPERQAENKEKCLELLEDFAASSRDPGVSRFFRYNIASLGPFDTQDEAEDCIRKRLENNVVSFTQDAIIRVPKVVARHPAGIVELSRAMHQLAVERCDRIADLLVLREAFISSNRDDVTNAIQFCQQLSDTDRSIYRIALSYESEFTCMTVCKHLLADKSEFPTDELIENIRAAFDRLVGAKFCTREDKAYWFSESKRAYALRLALEQ